MGVNVQHTQLPAEMAAKTTSFYQETQKTQNRAELVARILLELEQILPLLEQTDVTPLLQAWQKHDRLQGKEVNVIVTTEQYSGTVLGITPTGALRIALPGGSTKRYWLAMFPSVPAAKREPKSLHVLRQALLFVQ